MAQERKCRKCGEIIPYFMFIDGKRRGLKNRKFCLSCSPFGGNNRRADDPSLPSNTAKHTKNYMNWTDDQKQIHKLRTLRKRHERKKELVKMAGGKCIVCGYDKCIRAMTFHHRDPTTKKFELNMSTLNKTWNLIEEEFKKCDLLCIRCHTEIEDKINGVGYDGYDKKIEDGIEKGFIKKIKYVEPISCKMCGIVFKPNGNGRIFCSDNCSKMSQRKVERPSKEELSEFIKTTSFSTIGKQFGVSDNTIRKWCRNYGLF